MMQQLWKTFPRQLENKINNLLSDAEPTPAKAFQLYKSCLSEELWADSFENFSLKLNEFFAEARQSRRKSSLDEFLNKPIDEYLYDDFHLTFRTAAINQHSVREIASWAHNLMRVNCKVDIAATSIETLNKTILGLTTPGPFDKEGDLSFQDFCSAWKKTVGKLFGQKYDTEMLGLVRDLHRLDQQAMVSVALSRESKPQGDALYFTQTEINWATEVRRSAFCYRKIPKFPLSKGPQKLALIELERMTILYGIIQITDKPELLHYRESIRLTILERCDFLLPARVA